MLLNLTELTPDVRASMLAEFEAELAGATPFYPARLTPAGRDRWPDLLREAISNHDDEWLMEALLEDGLIVGFEMSASARSGVKSVNVRSAAQTMAMSEFNTWYVRGLSAMLLTEGIVTVRVYRAGMPKWSVAGCDVHDGQVVETQVMYEGHRARYWPTRTNVFAIPYQPNCHHSIQRV
ncbi:hypothetical protein [Aeromicrobium sp. 9AM]|uniref:hypothetical protein n=1 Tax=Aeromicrobium sp. 9AM TaxID=2653126 RepID=UPI0012F209A2|nr:hypothetical protein [Aeromicrobium sp. 9AM]VXB72526.1 conserved hypothetical protein [Aeromicrobium sp. 9AM]